MQILETSGRLLKWAIKLRQFEILYKPRITIKVQALPDFVGECTEFQDEPMREHVQELWKLFIDGSSNKNESRARIILISPEGHCFHTAFRFGFDDSNNEVEYEAYLARVHVAKELKERESQ